MDTYSDHELEAATGLSTLHVRRLITWGGISPASSGKGAVRKWERGDVRHVACVVALRNAGLSLPMAHTLAMLVPTPRVLIDIIDPAAKTKNKLEEKWFDPKVPLPVVEKTDVIATIVNGKNIHFQLGRSKRFFVGEFANDQSLVLTAFDFSNFRECDPTSLCWRFKPELKSATAQREASQALRHAISVTTCNLSLACKVAMRRLLGVPVFFEKAPKDT